MYEDLYKVLGILAVLVLLITVPALATRQAPCGLGDVKVVTGASMLTALGMPGDTGTITITLSNPPKSRARARPRDQHV